MTFYTFNDVFTVKVKNLLNSSPVLESVSTGSLSKGTYLSQSHPRSVCTIQSACEHSILSRNYLTYSAAGLVFVSTPSGLSNLSCVRL